MQTYASLWQPMQKAVCGYSSLNSGFEDRLLTRSRRGTLCPKVPNSLLQVLVYA